MAIMHDERAQELRDRFAALMATHPELAERKVWEAAEKLAISPAEIIPFLEAFRH